MLNRYYLTFRLKNLKIPLLLLSSNIALSTVTPALAAAPAGSTTSPLRSLFYLWNIIVIILCIARRKKEIGGWLLLYYIQLYTGAAASLIIPLFFIKNFYPSTWSGATGLYLLHLLSSIPSLLIIFVELVFAERLRKSRDFAHLPPLRKVLWFHFGFAVLGLVIDLLVFRDSVPLAVFGLVAPSIWLPYFYYSKRVNRVFRTHEWIFPNLGVGQSQGSGQTEEKEMGSGL
jgi:hypothetical protein